MNYDNDIVAQLRGLTENLRSIPWSGWYCFNFRGYMMAYIPDDGSSILRFCIPHFGSMHDYNQDAIINAINETNREVKYVKVSTLQSGAIVLNYDHKLAGEENMKLLVIHILTALFHAAEHLKRKIFQKNYGSRSKKGEFLRFELNHNALNRKPQK